MAAPAAHAGQLRRGQFRHGGVVRPGHKGMAGMAGPEPGADLLQPPAQDQVVVLPPAVEGEIAGIEESEVE